MTDRDIEVFRMRRAGTLIPAIAEHFGITKQRVHQILHATPPRPIVDDLAADLLTDARLLVRLLKKGQVHDAVAVARGIAWYIAQEERVGSEPATQSPIQPRSYAPEHNESDA
jgi:hypothetical protein